MTDLDVIQKIAKILGRKVRGPYKYKHNRKPVYYTGLFGVNAVIWMRRLLPLMGARRSSVIKKHLERWATAPGRTHKRGTGVTPECHPRRKHYALRLCRSCWRAKRYREGKPR